ncbi:tRNA pseudouridine(38-40) synthase TruA [Paracrocinitomix mangrovi]|uniref:tRNA pseudouridine(38-40) synthase TruA n=1 Tax=Paracrocinitomix mangrovi TaxID=2862509 RepID=UPI001C8D7C0F|nr:tRNA pseudouridine(38-40) synthase TruA [Paracrocinitomix mangrovi]UKN01382.1 tRNA pseudouridine(38-40) synthase TruA [Paracrocinitomix mangrovi]
MNRIFIKLAYKGTNFFGWQIQPNHPSVQSEIESVLGKLNGGKEVKITGCGRTDTGVHSSEYYAHCDLPFEMEKDQLIYKLNSMLPMDIVIQDILEVEAEAHARFDATNRTYHYFIHQSKDPFIDEISWYRKPDLDIESMNKACLMLVQHKDFECFSKVKTDVTNFLCDIKNAIWIKSEKGYIFSITANRFLRNMVRAIVGTMIEIGEGRMSLEEFQIVLDSRNRSEAGQSVPAKGLFLAKIEYPYL